jgi:Aromatic-ring-opening dioxygenase LigAB, LigA subunit
MTDYWLSKMFFDLQTPAAAASYRADRHAVIERYPLKPEVKSALLADDVGFIAKLVNPYLLRYYFTASGMKDDVFLDRIRASGNASGEMQHG